MNGNVGYSPLIEEKDNDRAVPGFLPENPRYVIGNGTFKKVPLLTGVTRDETANAIDLKNIEQIFSTTNTFLESLTKSVKNGGFGMAIGNVVGKVLPGVGKNISTNTDSYFSTFCYLRSFCLFLICIFHRKSIITYGIFKSIR